MSDKPSADQEIPAGKGDGDEGRPTRSGSDSPTLSTAGERPDHAHGNVYQTFNGAIYGSHARFGVETTQRARRATGRMDVAEIESLLRVYTSPAPFEKACRVLAEDRVVVLHGPDGIGKRSGAVALLREVMNDGALVVLSPDARLEDLAERTFDRGCGYVLLDRMSEATAAEVADFNWRRVRNRMSHCGSYFVVTTSRGTNGLLPGSVTHVRWEEPPAEQVLRSRLRMADRGEDIVSRTLDLMRPDCSLIDVVRVAARVAAGEEPEEAWQRHDASGIDSVQAWLHDEKRTVREIVEVTTLAFAAGSGQRTFESLVTLLEEELARTLPSAASSSPSMPVFPFNKAPGKSFRPFGLPDRRQALVSDGPIVARDVVTGGISRRELVFRTPEQQQWVLTGLWKRYESPFWDAVHAWLTELAGMPDPDSEEEDDQDSSETDLQVRIATGLALLAKTAFDEVEKKYLIPWSKGTAGAGGQALAAYVLWSMCTDESLATAALVMARKWAQSRDVDQRCTAALAFSGLLGVRFPTDAVKWLWHLTLQGEEMPEIGDEALAWFFAVLTECEEDASVVLAALDHRMRQHALRSGPDARLRTLTMNVALSVLTIRDLNSDRPAIAVFLHDRPEAIEKAAQLWSWLLRYRPRRREALTALHAALRALPGVSRQPLREAGLIGAALGRVLPADEYEPLHAELPRVAMAAKGHGHLDLVQSLLTAVGRSEGRIDKEAKDQR